MVPVTGTEKMISVFALKISFDICHLFRYVFVLMFVLEFNNKFVCLYQVSPDDSKQKETLERQLSQHTEQHHKQISALRDELDEKQSLITEIKVF